MTKNISIVQLVETVNNMLATSVCDISTRYGMITLLEKVLMDTGNYKGYGYLSAFDAPGMITPGVRFIGPELTADFDNTDPTRRRYSV